MSMTIEYMIDRLKAEAMIAPKGLQTEIRFAISPASNLEIASVYVVDEIVWVDLEEHDD